MAVIDERPFFGMAEGRMEGQITSGHGPVPNAKISVGQVSTFSDHEGKFRLDHIPPGIAKIKVEATNFSDYEQDILIEAGEIKKGLSFGLTEITGTLEGTITDQNGRPISAEVSGIFWLTRPPLKVKANKDGQYLIDGIPQGNYLINVSSEGYAADGARVRVTGKNSTKVDFTLASGDYAILGEILNKEQRSPIAAEVILARNGVVVARSSSDPRNGKYVFEKLAPDIYEIEVISSGYVSKSWRGKPDSSRAIDFELESNSSANCT